MTSAAGIMGGASVPGAQRPLSKSKLIAFRQCEKRLWLEVHRPDLRVDTARAQANFELGYTVGEVARRLYNPLGTGVLLDAQKDGFEATLQRSVDLLETDVPLFEAGFVAGGALAFADVMLPVVVDGVKKWRMVEVKSSTKVKDYHRDDIAIQAFVARASGVSLAAVAVAVIDNQWTYPGDGLYDGLLMEVDLTEEAFARASEVQTWISAAQGVACSPDEPIVLTGPQCAYPFDCGFLAHCRGQEPQVEYPVAWLPRVQGGALKDYLAASKVADLRDVPDSLLNQSQQRVKVHTLAGMTWFDVKGAAQSLARHHLPAYFLDFETIQFPVPIWAGTRPYSQIPFQFSLHRLEADGTLTHIEFLDLTGDDPSLPFAEALIDGCGETGPIFVYNAGFEKGRMKEAAARFTSLKATLDALIVRVVDLLPVAQAYYYHPSQQGSWSIKKVLPAVVPELRYDQLDGVQDGTAAMSAYIEAIASRSSERRKAELRKQLLAYCCLDTYAMVRLWQIFAGRSDLTL